MSGTASGDDARADPAATPAAPVDHRIPTGDGALHAREWRPGADRGRAPVVLLHDSLGCVALWREFPSRLAQASGRRVIAYDRLGFGRSDPHPGRLPRSFIGDEAHAGFDAVRRALGIGRFAAFGHSVGGGMAAGCAAAWPDDCAGLVTESAQAFVEERTVAGILAARDAFARPGQLDRLSRHHGDRAAWVLSAWIDTWLAPDFADWTLDDTLRRVRCPSLVLHGEHDEYGTALHPQRIAALTAGDSILQLLDGCGHLPHREQPERVLGLVADWLEGVE